MEQAKVKLDSSTSSGTHRNFVHASFGDLGRLDAVSMPASRVFSSWSVYDPTMIHLTVTGRCQARCQGCINAAITNPGSNDRLQKAPIADADPRRDAEAVIQLAKKHPDKEAVICFYGGEPLLKPQAILEIMDRIEAARPAKAVRYMLYTNGDLLLQISPKYPDLLKRFWLVSVSIDGQQRQHESIRLGTSLTRIRQGLSALKAQSRSKVMVWSTLRESQSLTDCFEEFMRHYRDQQAELFFWHWVETAEPYEDFDKYVLEYEGEFREIMQIYVKALQKGEILPLVHVNELILFSLSGTSRKSSGCGVELAQNYDLIDGKIHSCADLPQELAIGAIREDGSLEFFPHDLNELVAYKDTLGCFACGVHAYCGGRCPVQARIGDRRRLLQYCQLMRLHVGIVFDSLDEITAAIDKHGITPQAFYDQAALYAQFTDVTP